MKALVTGGAGFIGSHIIEHLAKDGNCDEIISLDNYSSGKHSNLDGIECRDIYCDVCDYDRVIEFMKGTDVVFHNAASKKNICLDNPKRDLEVNGMGTLNMLEAARKCGVKKFVHASTGSVYGEPLVFPQTENHPLNPVSYYGVSKLAGERYVNMYSKWLDITVLRYFHVYGPRQENDDKLGGVVAIFIKNALANKPIVIHGSGKQERSFTYVEDVVEANINAWHKSEAKGNVYNCASGLKIPVKWLADMIIEKTNSKSEIIYDGWLEGDIKKFDVDNSKITESLGINFINLEEGLERTIEYYYEKRK